VDGNVIYGVVIASYLPPLPAFFNTLRQLSVVENLNVYIVDSSPVTENKTEDFIRQLCSPTVKATIKYFKVPNRGIGYSYNCGISEAAHDRCDLITLFTDDVTLPGNFPTEAIGEFYKCNCKLEDVLFLPQNPQQLGRTVTRTVDTGMTFSGQLNLRFREEFILDQIDFDFSIKILKNGGRFVVFPKIVIEVLPVGRIEKDGARLLPPWRLYLLTRNAIALAFESNHKWEALRREAYPEIRTWAMAGIKSSRRLLLVSRAVFLGVNDGLIKSLGVTGNLQVLSKRRFVER
jgi:hypothetical protein